MKKDVITCGRKPDCDIVLKSDSKYINVGAYSSVHFTIKRV